MLQTDDEGQFSELSDIADGIFERCDDQILCIIQELLRLEPHIRNDLLSSDLLNCWQVFNYYFRADPGDLAEEFLTFHPAGELSRGVPMGEIGLYTLTFYVKDTIPEIKIEDDIQEIARFKGAAAWHETVVFLEGE
ncbi:MAG TPA: hypothetical protein VN372_12270 [Methanospirillum sp.]|nr:hypothetical protein [Methanospirillum sp.]